MWINKLEVGAFGKLRDRTFELTPGLNIIYGENGSGKSTLSMFIKSMLYGVGGNSKIISKSVRAHYSPWDGARINGRMYVTTEQGLRIIIERRCGASRVGDKCAVLDAVSGEALSITPEELIGIGEEAFSNSLFIRQLGTAVRYTGGQDEIALKLSNMAQTGDERYSSHKALTILQRGIRELQHIKGGGGAINRLKDTIFHLEQDLERAYAAHNRALQARATLIEAQSQRAQLLDEHEKMSARLAQAQQSLYSDRYRQAAEYHAQKETESKRALEKLALADAEQQRLSRFAQPVSFPPIPATDKITAQLALERRKRTLIGAVGALAGIKLLSGVLRFPPTESITAIAVAGLVFAVMLALWFIRAKRATALTAQRDEAFRLQKERDAQLKSLGITSPGEYELRRREWEMSCENRRETELECERIKGETQAAAAALAQAAADMVEPEPTDSPSANSGELHRRSAELSELIAGCESVISGAGHSASATPGDIMVQIEDNRERLSQLERRLSALRLAADAIGGAEEEFSQSLGERLNKSASQYMSLLTGGVYSRAMIARDYEIMLEEEGFHPLLCYSGGTRDQMYLALRFSIIDALYENLPLFLDDILTQFDARRQDLALDFLREYSKKHQVIFFTLNERLSSPELNECVHVL